MPLEITLNRMSKLNLTSRQSGTIIAALEFYIEDGKLDNEEPADDRNSPLTIMEAKELIQGLEHYVGWRYDSMSEGQDFNDKKGGPTLIDLLEPLIAGAVDLAEAKQPHPEAKRFSFMDGNNGFPTRRGCLAWISDRTEAISAARSWVPVGSPVFLLELMLDGTPVAVVKL